MRAQSVIGVLLGALATAALAQVATAPIEQKGGANSQIDEATPADNRTTPANGAAPVNSSAPKDEAVPADPPANGVAPIEPKL